MAPILPLVSRCGHLSSLAAYGYNYRRYANWYGIDEFGSVHDVIGTRCDPYTQQLLAKHLSLLLPFQFNRAFADFTSLSLADADPISMM